MTMALNPVEESNLVIKLNEILINNMIVYLVKVQKRYPKPKLIRNATNN